MGAVKLAATATFTSAACTAPMKQPRAQASQRVKVIKASLFN
jgi:hypothetical protein